MYVDRPIAVEFRPQLTASRGKLLSGVSRGRPVHAATFIRERRMVFETGLRARPARFRRIFVHELFHFVWSRLSPAKRASYDALLRAERAAGEAGESAAVAKEKWRAGRSEAAWKNYVVESFCDTAAAMYGPQRDTGDMTLAGRWLERRKAWFAGSRPAKGWRC